MSDQSIEANRYFFNFKELNGSNFLYTADFTIGNKSMANSTEKNIKVLIDTRLGKNYVIGSNCTSSNSTNKYTLNPYASIITQDLAPQKVRQTNITKAMVVNETLCAKINGRDLCASNHSVAIIHNVTGLNIEVDGIISFGPFVGNNMNSSENFMAGIMNGYQNRTDGIDKMEVYIDFKNKKVDFEHASAEGFQR